MEDKPQEESDWCCRCTCGSIALGSIALVTCFGLWLGGVFDGPPDFFRPTRVDKTNPFADSEELAGKTAWREDLETEELGSFAHWSCVAYGSGALFETIYDNPGMVRVFPSVSSQQHSPKLVLSDMPYPGVVACDGARTAFIASTVKPSSVAAVSWTGSGDTAQVVLRSRVTELPRTCGGIIAMKYSTEHKLLVASCGTAPAALLPIAVDDTNPDEIVLTPRALVTVAGPEDRNPRGLVVVDTSAELRAVRLKEPSFVIVGLTGGKVVKLTLPDLTFSSSFQTRGMRLGYFAVGNGGQTLAMFSPFPWRRLLTISTMGNISRTHEYSFMLDQDMERIVDISMHPGSSMGYVVGNSVRRLPVILQFDVENLSNWGLVLAGMCTHIGDDYDTSEAGDADLLNAYCEWGPKGRYAQAQALDTHPARPPRLYVSLASTYCAHCKLADPKNNERCMAGMEEEDYYDPYSYCFQEAWNTRKLVYSGDMEVGQVDYLSGLTHGGDNASVAIMQLGEIPKVGGISASGQMLPSTTVLVFAVAAALAAMRWE